MGKKFFKSTVGWIHRTHRKGHPRVYVCICAKDTLRDQLLNHTSSFSSSRVLLILATAPATPLVCSEPRLPLSFPACLCQAPWWLNFSSEQYGVYTVLRYTVRESHQCGRKPGASFQGASGMRHMHIFPPNLCRWTQELGPQSQTEPSTNPRTAISRLWVQGQIISILWATVSSSVIWVSTGTHLTGLYAVRQGM